jgi:hypothetical protein
MLIKCLIELRENSAVVVRYCRLVGRCWRIYFDALCGSDASVVSKN